MKGYKTAQRKLLFEFLSMHCDRQFTVDELAGEISGISVSAIYRNINQLIASGAVRRFEQQDSRKFLYQYVGGGDCCDNIHLKCEKCGVIFHMDKEATEALVCAVKKNGDFDLHRGKTVLPGSCKLCK